MTHRVPFHALTIRASALALCLYLGSAACGGDDDGDDGGGDDGGGDMTAGQPDAAIEGPDAAGGGTFDCFGTDCVSGAQYCLTTYTGEVQDTADCVDLPEGCSDCACAQADAPDQFPTSNNCSEGAVISCSQLGDWLSVSCRR